MDDIRKLIEKNGLILAKEIDGLEQIFNRFENMVNYDNFLSLSF